MAAKARNSNSCPLTGMRLPTLRIAGAFRLAVRRRKYLWVDPVVQNGRVYPISCALDYLVRTFSLTQITERAVRYTDRETRAHHSPA